MRASFLFDAMHSSPEWTFVVNSIGESWLVFYMFSPFHTLVNVRKLFLRVWILNAMFFLAEYIISTTIRTSCERSSPSMQPFVLAFSDLFPGASCLLSRAVPPSSSMLTPSSNRCSKEPRLVTSLVEVAIGCLTATHQPRMYRGRQEKPGTSLECYSWH